jgi:MFS family permease
MDILFDPAPGNKRRWAMIILASLSAALSWFCRNALTVIFPAVSLDLNLDAQDLGLLSALFFYFFAGSQIPLGIFLVKFRVGLVMGLGILTASLGCLLFASAADAYPAFVGRALMGMGTSVTVMGGMALTAMWFSTAHFALISGFMMAVAGGGSMLATSPWVILTDAWGWRAGMNLSAAILFITALLCFVVMRNPVVAKGGIQSAKFPLRQAMHDILQSPRFWLMGLTTGFRYGFLSTLQAVWAGPLLIYGLGLTQARASHILLFLAISYSISMPLVGWMSDKLFAARKMIVCCGQALMAILAFSCLWWTAQTPLWLVTAYFILLPFFAASGNVIFAHTKELNLPELAPTAIAWINIFPLLSGAICIQFTSIFLPNEVTAISSPQDLAHLWWLGTLSMGLTAAAYAGFIPESPAMLRLRQIRRAAGKRGEGARPAGRD